MTTLTRYVVQCRSTLDGDILRGHAAVFGQASEIFPGYMEQIARGAFDKVLASDQTDVRALMNHDPAQLLGRQSAGTLRLKVDEEGLGFEVDLPDTSYANDLRALVARGDLTGASFAFLPGETRNATTEAGSHVTEHVSVERLLDVSAVTFPAYEGAAVSLRRYDFARPSGRAQMAQARARVLLKGKATT